MEFTQNEINRFGSAVLSTEREIAKAGMFDWKPGALFIGFLGKRALWYHGMGGVLLTAGARGGKLRDLLGYNICSAGSCHAYAQSMVVLDMKGECSYITQDLTKDGIHIYYWNPARLHGLPRHRINPVDYIRIDSPSLVSDVKVFTENMIPLSGSAQSAYFERRGREFLESLILTLVRIKGVLTLPDLYRIINLIPGGGDAWLDFAFEMSESGFEISARIEEEIANSRDESGNGFQGILGEIFKAFACLSDPILMASVSPPFDFSMAQLCESDTTYRVNLMPPAEFIDAWSPIIKSIIVAGMLYKSRSPSAPQQTYLLDECAQLGAFPLIPKLFSYGAGIGIRPFAVFQSTAQINALGPEAESIITSSAACRIYFAIREIGSATAISRMLGAQTLEFDDEAAQSRASHAKQQALQSLLGGGDPFSAGLSYAHHKEQAERRTKQHRLLRTPDEVLNTPEDKSYIFTDGLQGAIYADRRPYFSERSMAGRFHPNPYHPPLDSIRVKTRWGFATRRVVSEQVPARFAHLPQYKDGQWSRFEG